MPFQNLCRHPKSWVWPRFNLHIWIHLNSVQLVRRNATLKLWIICLPVRPSGMMEKCTHTQRWASHMTIRTIPRLTLQGLVRWKHCPMAWHNSQIFIIKGFLPQKILLLHLSFQTCLFSIFIVMNNINPINIFSFNRIGSNLEKAIKMAAFISLFLFLWHFASDVLKRP